MKPQESKAPSSSEDVEEQGEDSGVTIPEDFQKKVASFLSGCEDANCLDYLSQAISKKRMSLDKEEQDEMLDTEGMPEE